jgi:hypothetical protein
VNGRVRARPAALHAFATHGREGDLRIAGALEDAREAVARYVATCDEGYVEDPGPLLGAVDGALERRLATVAAVGDLGRAFAAMDRFGWAVVRGDERGLARAVAARAGLPADLTTWLAGHHQRRWEELLSGEPGGRCPTFASGRYVGGGFLRGPDGELYPLVVPEVQVDGDVRNAAGATLSWTDVETLRGADDAWFDVARRSGTTRFGPEPSVLFTVLAAMAGMNPNLVPTTRPIPRTAVDALGFGARGLTGAAAVPRPTRLQAPPPAPSSGTSPATSPAPDGPQHGPAVPGTWLDGPAGAFGSTRGTAGLPPLRGDASKDGERRHGASGGGARRPGVSGAGDRGTEGSGPRWVRSARAAEARGAGVGLGLDTIVTLGESLSLASSMRDHGLAHVDVRFQRTPDGRRRAIARSVTGRTGAQGTVLLPTYLTADEDGTLRPVPMRADPHPTMGDPERPLVVDWGQDRTPVAGTG